MARELMGVSVTPRRSNAAKLETSGVDEASASDSDEFLQRIIDRSKFVLDMSTCSIEGEKKSKPVGDVKHVRIACISSSLRIDDASGELVGVNVGDYAITAPARKTSLEAWAQDRLCELRAAIGTEKDKQPHIVCFGELTYPPPLYGPDIGSDTPARAGISSRRSYKFDGEIREVLNELDSDAFVFAGSFHCVRTQYAVGVMFPYGRHVDKIKVRVSSEWRRYKSGKLPARGAARTGEAGASSLAIEDEEVTASAPFIYKKRNPARSIGEVTRIPPYPDFQIFERKVGHVAVLLCSDILDLNQFLGISRANLNNPELPLIDYILVPSFNTGEHFPEYCKELSAWAGAVVINVNANHADSNFSNTALHLCGLTAAELQRDGVIGEPQTKVVELPSKQRSVITTFAIDPIKCDQRRSKHLNSDPFQRFKKRTLSGEEVPS